MFNFFNDLKFKGYILPMPYFDKDWQLLPNFFLIIIPIY